MRFKRLVSAASAFLRWRSSASTCLRRRAVSASSSHWERGSVGGGREEDWVGMLWVEVEGWWGRRDGREGLGLGLGFEVGGGW